MVSARSAHAIASLIASCLRYRYADEAQRLGVVGILVEHEPDQLGGGEEVLLERERARGLEPRVALGRRHRPDPGAGLPSS